jgi:predicted  nucleic acid-binding Zn-ribbon protein
MKIEVSDGEVVDKLTIVEIKLLNIKDEQKLANLKREFEVLDQAVGNILSKTHPLYNELLEINKKLWDIEDKIRECEREKDFSQKFIELARSVYFTNDKRSEVKRRINEVTNSDLKEEKSYENYYE